jgi:hypothetical protein
MSKRKNYHKTSTFQLPAQLEQSWQALSASCLTIPSAGLSLHPLLQHVVGSARRPCHTHSNGRCRRRRHRLLWSEGLQLLPHQGIPQRGQQVWVHLRLKRCGVSQDMKLGPAAALRTNGQQRPHKRNEAYMQLS